MIVTIMRPTLPHLETGLHPTIEGITELEFLVCCTTICRALKFHSCTLPTLVQHNNRSSSFEDLSRLLYTQVKGRLSASMPSPIAGFLTGASTVYLLDGSVCIHAMLFWREQRVTIGSREQGYCEPFVEIDQRRVQGGRGWV